LAAVGDVLANAAISILVGVGLWALLPRGVVLTRGPLPQAPGGEPPYQRWQIRNDSPLPVVLTKVTHAGVHTYNDRTGTIDERDLPPDEDERAPGISLVYDDEVQEISRQEPRPKRFRRKPREPSWRGQRVLPGDTLTAYVDLNRTLTLYYRRAGMFGVLERRRISIDGGV